jgi:starch synthase
VVHAAAEVAPFCVTGGLGEVLAALPGAQQRAGAEVAVIVPRCRSAGMLDLADTGIDIGPNTRLLADGDGLYFVDAPHYFDRPRLYEDETGPYPDDAERFEFFAKAVVAAAPRILGSAPDVINVHDWHAGLVPALTDLPTVFTIHNHHYQGEFAAGVIDAPAAGYDTGESFNFMRGAIATADRVTTVSPTYAAEIQTPELGAGLDELLSKRGVTGIVNGLDLEGWDPATNPALSKHYDAGSPGAKAANREHLLGRFSIDADPDLVIGVVSRFAYQKGIDILAELAPRLADLDAVLIVLGNGDLGLEGRLSDAAAEYPNELAVVVGWDLELSHQIIAGSDVVAVPSRYEPCGLIQMQSMRYGAIPVVHAVGGLADTVVDPGDEAMPDRGTGFAFSPLTVDNLAEALDRAATLRHDTASWERLVTRVMKADWSWDRSASKYLELYETL